MKKLVIITGIFTVLLAVPLGNILAEVYLAFSGGMETERFLICVEAFINGFQLLGGICAGLGGLSVVLQATAKYRV